MTTVRQDIDGLRRLAVQTWIGGINDPRRKPVRRNVPVELVVRESTARGRR